MPTTRRRKRGAVERRLEDFARSKPGSWFFVNVAMRIDRVLLPLSRGRVSISVGRQVGMLETVGAKSGQVRRTPLLFVRDGNHVVLIASKGGAPRHPAWLHNLRANPKVRFPAPAASPASTSRGRPTVTSAPGSGTRPPTTTPGTRPTGSGPASA